MKAKWEKQSLKNKDRGKLNPLSDKVQVRAKKKSLHSND